MSNIHHHGISKFIYKIHIQPITKLNVKLVIKHLQFKVLYTDIIYDSQHISLIIAYNGCLFEERTLRVYGRLFKERTLRMDMHLISVYTFLLDINIEN